VRNHNQKIKDMAESVLPSTGRKGARETRRNLHHTERARTRTALYNWVRSTERADLDISPASTYRSDIRELVYDRRSADKVGPLVRCARWTPTRHWCRAPALSRSRRFGRFCPTA
jgi:hypothetical protein